MAEIAALHLSLSICHGKMCRRSICSRLCQKDSCKITNTNVLSKSQFSYRNTVMGCCLLFLRFFSQEAICDQAMWVLPQRTLLVKSDLASYLIHFPPRNLPPHLFSTRSPADLFNCEIHDVWQRCRFPEHPVYIEMHPKQSALTYL